jgi:glycine/D-amino acid oxidase-like deaminating enzyme
VISASMLGSCGHTNFMHLLSMAVAKGVNLRTHTPVLSGSQTRDEDGFWRFQTSRGSIKAKTVVYATNGFSSALLPEYTGTVFPVRAICLDIKTSQDNPVPRLTASYCINFGQSWDYLIQRSDGSMIVGGGNTTFKEDLSQWRNKVDDSTLIEPARHYFDDYMQRNLTGWETSGAYVNKIWTGSKFDNAGQ